VRSCDASPASVTAREACARPRALSGPSLCWQVGEAAVGSAVKSAMHALSPNGGRVVCFFGSPPTLGVGKVCAARHSGGRLPRTAPAPPAGRDACCMMHAACIMLQDARRGTHHCCAAARARRFRAMTTPPRSVRTARRSCSHLTGPSTHRRVQPPAALAVSLLPLLAPADPTPARTRCRAPQGSQVLNYFVAAPQLAKECSAAQVSVDLHACTRVFSDLMSMGQVCRLTGGQLSYIPGFDGAPAALPPKQTTKPLEAKPTPPGDA